MLGTGEVGQGLLLAVLRYEDVLVLHDRVLNAGPRQVLYTSCYFRRAIMAVVEPIIACTLMLPFLLNGLLRRPLHTHLRAAVLAA